MIPEIFPFSPSLLPLWVALAAVGMILAVFGVSLFFALRGDGEKEGRPPEEGPSVEL